MKIKKVGIKDIAAMAGVSHTTVSRALRRDPKTKQKTIEKILTIADEMGYYPNLLAKNLRENKTNTIGIIFNDLNNPFYAEILTVINEELVKENFSMIVSFSNYNFSREQELLILMLSKKVDGIIISPIDGKSKNLKILFDNDIETVLIDSLPYYNNASYVYTDHRKSSALATEYLINNGHKKILLLTGPYKNSLVKQFVEGHISTLKDNNIKINKDLILNADEHTIGSGYTAFKELINDYTTQRKLDFTAILTNSDLIAIGVYKVAKELGIEIPANYSIIGQDNIEITSILSPPLTTIHQPRKRIGAECARILLNNIKNKNKKLILKTALEPKLIIRGSVRKIN